MSKAIIQYISGDHKHCGHVAMRNRATPMIAYCAHQVSQLDQTAVSIENTDTLMPPDCLWQVVWQLWPATILVCLPVAAKVVSSACCTLEGMQQAVKCASWPPTTACLPEHPHRLSKPMVQTPSTLLSTIPEHNLAALLSLAWQYWHCVWGKLLSHFVLCLSMYGYLEAVLVANKHAAG